MATATLEGAVTRRGARRPLPAWPLLALLWGYPLWWVLGVGSFSVVLAAVPMLGAMVLRGAVRVPRWGWLWCVFLLSVAAASAQLDSPLRLVGFGLRASNLAAVAVVFVYLYNIPPKALPGVRVLSGLLALWATVVVGGVLGLLLPDVQLTTPLARVLPGPILANDYVQDLVLPTFAEVQEPWGASAPFVRPSAPFPYTNGWGCAYALLLPVCLLAIQRSRGWRRLLPSVLLVVSVVPAAATLNRGMYLAVAVALGYVALRASARGHVRALVVLVLGMGVLASVALVSGAAGRLLERTSVSGTNSTRLALYEEAFRRTLQSPVLGYGAPRPSEVVGVSVGTQGQVWNVMFSYGFIALVCFVGTIWWCAWRTRRAAGAHGLWLHTTLVVASLTIFYYGYDGIQLSVVAVCAALLLRPGADVPSPAARSSVHAVGPVTGRPS